MQLNLAFLDIPSPHAGLWERLDEAQRALVLETLARLIAQAALADEKERDHD